MSWKTVLAIYILFWVMSAFLVLPFEARAAGSSATHIAGQERGAPSVFSARRVIGRTTLVSAILFGLFYTNYVQGWITPDMLSLAR